MSAHDNHRDGLPQADIVTVLFSNSALAKTWTKDGSIQNFGHPLWFKIEEHAVRDIQGLHDLLVQLEEDPHRCIIRGKPRPNWRQIQLEQLPRWESERKQKHDREVQLGKRSDIYTALTPPGPDWALRRLELFEDIPHHWILCDVDGFPAGTDDSFDAYLTAMPPSFDQASFCWQMSGSAGHTKHAGKLKAHLWFWSATKYSSAELRAWSQAVNAPRTESKLCMLTDSALFNPVQIHYTAAPLFAPGVDDPIELRSGFVGNRVKGGCVEIAITEAMRQEASVTSKSRCELKDPRTKSGLLGAFHRAFPIEMAVARFIPEEFVPVTESRWTWVHGGGAPEGVFVRSDRQGLGAMHNTWPWGTGRTANTFDIVRHFLFGHLDETDNDLERAVYENSPANRPSFSAMLELIKKLPEVQYELQTASSAQHFPGDSALGAEPPLMCKDQNSLYPFPPPCPGPMALAVAAALKASPKPQPELSTLAALIGMASACSGSYHYRGSRLNLYGTGVAGTGWGKDLPRDVAAKFAKVGGAKVWGKPASGQGLEDVLTDDHGILLEIDEIAHLMASINGTRAPAYLIEIAAVMLRLFSASATGYNTRLLAKSSTSASSRALQHPCLNIIGFATPEKLGEAVSVSNVEDGLLGRMLFAFGRDGVPIDRIDNGFSVPDKVAEAATHVRHALTEVASMDSGRSSIEVKATDEADARLLILMREFDRKANDGHSPFAKALLVRSFEKCQRVAAVLAVWDNPYSPVITINHVNWAEQLVKASDSAALHFCGAYMHGGTVQSDAALIKKLLQRILKGEFKPQRANELQLLTEQKVAHSFLLRASKLNKRRFDEAIEHLVDLADIRKGSISSQQANGKAYFISFFTQI